MEPSVDGPRLGRLGVLVGASTLSLTASFVGVVALASGEARGTTARIPVYVTATAVVFVAGVVLFEESRHRGRSALIGSTLVAAATLFVAGFGGEGVVYALSNPAAVFEVQLLGYLVSAALLGTGVGYWTWRNWELLRVAGIADAL
ncbi:hypothetical protein [Halolamina salifodinae]|uniref:Uncharacterized protein n=1 Tax=Halolamina salifodinae TaxID=1202767 RepID=A0A8T4GY73_9EURY|nr:hypothetical protein [Halolamina salifodinae]MBP1987073.1 hypothetical protein [Halolamina salifodinae]